MWEMLPEFRQEGGILGQFGKLMVAIERDHTLKTAEG